jgi:DNA-binding response OmpR family regulator
MRKILVIHHDAKFLSQVDSSLSQAGFEVRTSQSISKAILEFREILPDLVIWDVAKKDGFEDICRMQEKTSVSIIVVGEYPSREGWVKATEAGADLYLEEPVSPVEMVARVKAIMRRKKSSDNFDLICPNIGGTVQ